MLCVSSPNLHFGWTIAGTAPERPEGSMVAWDAALFGLLFCNGLHCGALKAPSTSAKGCPSIDVLPPLPPFSISLR
jgi:hypothetical protein